MSAQRKRILLMILTMTVGLSVLLSGCGGGGGQAPAVLTTIEITPSNPTIEVGQEQVFSAIGKDQYGDTMVISPAWDVTPAIGSLDLSTGAQVTFSATLVGTGTITASVGDVTGTTDVTVSPEPPELAKVEVSPDPHTLEEGETAVFTVTGYDQYDNTIAISTTASWSVTGSIGTVSPAEGLSTTFTAVTAGSGTVAVSVASFSDAAMVTVTPAPIYVPDDYATIQGAINASSPGDVIIVRPGTYNEHITFVNKDVTLRSTNPDDPTIVAGTVISGDGGSGSVVKFFANGPGAILEGFTITGSTQGTYVNSYYSGAGILVQSSSSVIRKNRIINNSCGDKGGGIAVISGSPVIEDNLIDGNSAGIWGGGLYLAGLTAGHSITENTVSNNAAANGGGIAVDQCSAQLTNNIIEFNSTTTKSANGYGGGIYARLFSSGVNINGCTIRNNSAYRAGGLFIYTDLDSEINNSQFSDNVAAEKGGGIYCFGNGTSSTCYLVNSTLDSNSAPSGGGVYVGVESIYAGNLHGSGNTFTSNSQYAITVASGAFWTDGGNNTFDSNTPGNVYP